MAIAQDLMTSAPKMIQSGDSLQDVIKLFLNLGITSSPVINPLGEILGILTELSLVKCYMLHKAKFHKNDKVGHHIEHLRPVHYINSEASLSDVVREIIASPTNRLLVLNDKKKVVGIISPKDLMRAMLGEVNPSENLRDKLTQAEEKLKSSLEKISDIERHLDVYKKMFHETPYMMHAVDQNGNILMANKRTHDTLGYENGELVGKTMLELYAQQMHGPAEEGLKQLIKDGKPMLAFTTVLKKDGSLLRCDIASTSMRDGNGRFISTISAMRPVDSEDFLKNVTGLVNDKDGPLSKYTQNPK